MKLGNVVRSSALVVGVVAANLAVFAGSALAGDRYQSRTNGYGHGRHYQAAPNYGYGGHYSGQYRKKRNNNGAAIAFGIGALILGSIIASEAGRNHRHYNDND